MVIDEKCLLASAYVRSYFLGQFWRQESIFTARVRRGALFFHTRTLLVATGRSYAWALLVWWQGSLIPKAVNKICDLFPLIL